MEYQKTKQIFSSYYLQFYFAGLTKSYPWWLDTHGNDTWSGVYTFDSDAIFYLLEGEFELRIRDEAAICVHAGQMIYIPAGVTHERRICSDAPLRKYYCSFDLSLGKDSLFHLFDGPYILDITDHETVVEIFESLLSFHRQDDRPFAAIGGNGVLLQLISFYLEQSNAPLITKEGRMDRSMQEVVRYIHTNLHQLITVQELADLAGYSVGHFTKIFKTTFSCLPQDYITKLKLSRAKKLLRETRLSNAALAEQFGFCDASYFGKFFKKHTGLTPVQYRKTVKFKI